MLYLGTTTNKALNTIVLSGDEAIDLTGYLGKNGAADGWFNVNQTAGDASLTSPIVADGKLHVQGKGILGGNYRDARLDLTVDDLTTKEDVLTVYSNLTAAKQLTLNNQEIIVEDGGIFVVDNNLNGKNSVITTKRGGNTIVNSTRRGETAFEGAFHTDNGGISRLTLGYNGGTLPADAVNSVWTVTNESNLTYLTLGRKGIVYFNPAGDIQRFVNKRADPTDARNAIVSVSGDEAVHLHETAGISLARGWNSLSVGDEINLIHSQAGFTKDGSALALPAGTDLDAFKSDLTVTHNSSLARVTTDTLAKNRYGLSLKTDNLLVATIKMPLTMLAPAAPGTGVPPGTVVPPGSVVPPGAIVPPDVGVPPSSSAPSAPDIPSRDEVNPETNVLMESSLSVYGTLVAADDLLVDTILRSRKGGHEGAFAAARAGRWHFDTAHNQKANITSGLLGYAVQASNSEYGAWVEIGNASYKAKTAAKDIMTSGNGKHNYVGAGVYGNIAMPLDGWLVSGYLKAGALENNFETMLTSQVENFDRTSVYWGAYLGTHYDFNLTSRG